MSTKSQIPIQSTFTAEIIDLRKKQGFSQRDIGKKLNLHYTTIAKWEKDLSSITLSNLVSYLKAIDLKCHIMVEGVQFEIYKKIKT